MSTSVWLSKIGGGHSRTTFSALSQKAVGKTSSTFYVHQDSRRDDKIGRLGAVGEKRIAILPNDGVGNQHITPHASYVRCSGDEYFPDVIRVYDPNNFASGNWFFAHPKPLSLKARFHRACRAFVNAWRQT